MVLWFPAAGDRGNKDGGLTGSPSCGRLWTSSPYAIEDNYGGYLYFNTNGVVDPRCYGYRASSYSVRCVSAITCRKNYYLWCLFLYRTILFAIGSTVRNCFTVE